MHAAKSALDLAGLESENFCNSPLAFPLHYIRVNWGVTPYSVVNCQERSKFCETLKTTYEIKLCLIKKTTI
jgi:hypothetical protein